MSLNFVTCASADSQTTNGDCSPTVNSGGKSTININCNVQHSKNTYKLPKPFPGEIDYKKLASPAFNNQFIGKTVIFRAFFISEWSEIAIYNLAGISTDKFIFLNHRDINYAITNSPLGSSDTAFPPFPISVSFNQADLIYSLHNGDFILVKGQVEKPYPKQASLSNIFDFARIYIKATEIKKLISE